MLDESKDFLLDRLDDVLEPLARKLTGKLQWDEMKENALRATTSARGGARHVAALVRDLVEKTGISVHVVGHSAGSILLAPLVQLLTHAGEIPRGPLAGEQGLGMTIDTCTLWAPACTVACFDLHYRPSIEAGGG